MKESIHPNYVDTKITCTCGAVYLTRSTSKELSVAICAACHPYFTGEHKLIDTARLVDKFTKRFGATTARRTAPKLATAGA